MATSWRGTWSRSRPAGCAAPRSSRPARSTRRRRSCPWPRCSTPPTGPALGQLQPEHVDARVAPEERQQHGEQQERHLDHEPPGDRRAAAPAPMTAASTTSAAVDAERPELLLRRGHDGDTNSTVASSLHCGARRCSGPSSWTRRWRWRSAHVSPTRWPAGGVERARAGGRATTTPAPTTNVTATPTRPATTVPTVSLSTPDDAVVGERAAGERALGRVGVDALVGGDLLEPVRARSWRAGRRTRRARRRRQADGDEREQRDAGRGDVSRPWRQRRCGRRHVRGRERRTRDRGASPSPTRRPAR